jgi:hypothetical protein
MQPGGWQFFLKSKKSQENIAILRFSNLYHHDYNILPRKNNQKQTPLILFCTDKTPLKSGRSERSTCLISAVQTLSVATGRLVQLSTNALIFSFLCFSLNGYPYPYSISTVCASAKKEAPRPVFPDKNCLL